MNKLIITLTTEADIIMINKDMNKIIKQLIEANIPVQEYTIQKAIQKVRA